MSDDKQEAEVIDITNVIKLNPACDDVQNFDMKLHMEKAAERKRKQEEIRKSNNKNTKRSYNLDRR